VSSCSLVIQGGRASLRWGYLSIDSSRYTVQTRSLFCLDMGPLKGLFCRISSVSVRGANPSPSCSLWSVPSSLIGHRLLLFSYMQDKRKTISSCSACSHYLQDLAHLLLECSAPVPICHTIFTPLFPSLISDQLELQQTVEISRFFRPPLGRGRVTLPSAMPRGLGAHLFVKVSRPGDSKVTFSVESSCHLLLSV